MNFLNVDIPVKNVPELDKGFVPLGLFFKNYQKGAAKPLCIAVERSGGQIGTYETKIYGTRKWSRPTRIMWTVWSNSFCGAGAASR